MAAYLWTYLDRGETLKEKESDGYPIRAAIRIRVVKLTGRPSNKNRWSQYIRHERALTFLDWWYNIRECIHLCTHTRTRTRTHTQTLYRVKMIDLNYSNEAGNNSLESGILLCIVSEAILFLLICIFGAQCAGTTTANLTSSCLLSPVSKSITKLKTGKCTVHQK